MRRRVESLQPQHGVCDGRHGGEHEHARGVEGDRQRERERGGGEVAAEHRQPAKKFSLWVI